MAIVLPFNVGDTVYRADMERRREAGERMVDSVPYIEALTVARIEAAEDAQGKKEIAFTAVRHGALNGQVWYSLDEKRGIPYGYKIETTRLAAIASAQGLYLAEVGQAFTGTVVER